MFSELVIASNHLILCHPLLSLPSNFPSLWIFFNVAIGKKWSKYWNVSFSINSSN